MKLYNGKDLWVPKSFIFRVARGLIWVDAAMHQHQDHEADPDLEKPYRLKLP